MVISILLTLVLPASAETPADGPRLRIVAEREVTIPDPEAVLSTAHGFLVDRLDGREFGVVDDVETAPDGTVTALVVAGGWFGRRRSRIAMDEIETIIPAERRIVVRV